MLGSIGLVISALLLWRQTAGKDGGQLPGCQTTGWRCDLVLGSYLGRFFGWPVSVFAVGYFVVLLAAVWDLAMAGNVTTKRRIALVLPALTIVGVAAVG